MIGWLINALLLAWKTDDACRSLSMDGGWCMHLFYTGYTGDQHGVELLETGKYRAHVSEELCFRFNIGNDVVNKCITDITNWSNQYDLRHSSLKPSRGVS